MEQRIIDKMVKASGVKAGEIVLVHFWGEGEELPIAWGFMEAVAALGASPVMLHQARSVNQRLFASAREGCYGEKYFRMLDAVDAVLDIFAYRPIVLGAQLEEAQQAHYRRYMAALFKQLMKCRRFAQIRIPTTANAEESGMDPQAYIRRMNAAYDVDYEALQAACHRMVQTYQGKRYVLRTGNGCELHVDLTGRSWHVDAGDGDWPCGEIYIAPVEEKTDGHVYFPSVWVEDAGRFGPVTLRVCGGRVVDCDDPGMQAWLDQLPGEGRVVAELGIGMNQSVQDLCGYTVLDEKMAGTFHIALGSNSMFGGKQDAPLHVDLVGQGRWTLEEENNDA